MEIKKVIDYEMDQNTYVIYKEDNNYCIVIDPGNSYEKLFTLLKQINKNVEAVLLTHCHYDHICGLHDLLTLTDAKVIASEECSHNINQTSVNVSEMFGENLNLIKIDQVVSDGEEFQAGGLTIHCIKTPGHTDCSVCYQIEKDLFTGDTLFLRTTGRWDLPTGDYQSLVQSIKEKIYNLDENIKVYPGHGDETTIGYEKKFNMSINTNSNLKHL